jgi:hypothetical protein
MINLNPIHAPVRVSVAEGFRCVSTGIGAWGEAIRLSVPAQMVEGVFGTAEQSGWASSPKTHTDQTYAAIVSVTTATNTIVRQLPIIATAYPIVQTLPKDNLLVVAQRSQRSSDGTHEQNAKVYRADGALAAEFCLGDGIEHVQADKAGRLWVGYFDEGIFGNFGWGTGEGATPLGVAGLVCYDTRGRKLWEFQPPPGFEDMADCYALNVAEEAVWACYYTDFPIVCVDPQRHTKAWTTELSGPRALAVSGDSVLAYGGHKHRQDCNLLRLRDGRAEHVAQVTLHLPHPLDPSAGRVIGRDNLLHLFTPDEWYVFSVPS